MALLGFFYGFVLVMKIVNVSPLGEVANFVTVYFPLRIKFLAERKREFTTKIRNLAKRLLPAGVLS
jgi:hypothetical protein